MKGAQNRGHLEMLAPHCTALCSAVHCHTVRCSVALCGTEVLFSKKKTHKKVRKKEGVQKCFWSLIFCFFTCASQHDFYAKTVQCCWRFVFQKKKTHKRRTKQRAFRNASNCPEKAHKVLKTNSLCAFRETTKCQRNWNIKDVPAKAHCAVRQSSSAQDICLVCFFAVTTKRHNATKKGFCSTQWWSHTRVKQFWSFGLCVRTVCFCAQSHRGPQNLSPSWVSFWEISSSCHLWCHCWQCH